MTIGELIDQLEGILDSNQADEDDNIEIALTQGRGDLAYNVSEIIIGTNEEIYLVTDTNTGYANI